MRVFTVSSISEFAVVKVTIQDDKLELPSDLNELQVHFFHIEDNSGKFEVYREGNSMICFSSEDDELLKEQKQKDAPVFSATLLYLITTCQIKRLQQLVVR
jgi:hypothetical protein